MGIEVVSGVHGNCFAVDAALADLQRHAVDQIICLGDTLQGGAQPAETVKRLHALACPIVMGNADAWLLAEENDTAEPTTEQQREVRLWTLSQLSADDLAFIRRELGECPETYLTLLLCGWLSGIVHLGQEPGIGVAHDDGACQRMQPLDGFGGLRAALKGIAHADYLIHSMPFQTTHSRLQAQTPA